MVMASDGDWRIWHDCGSDAWGDTETTLERPGYLCGSDGITGPGMHAGRALAHPAQSSSGERHRGGAVCAWCTLPGTHVVCGYGSFGSGHPARPKGGASCGREISLT